MRNENQKLKIFLIMLSFGLITLITLSNSIKTLANEISIIPKDVLYEDIINYSNPLIGIVNKDSMNNVNRELSLTRLSARNHEKIIFS